MKNKIKFDNNIWRKIFIYNKYKHIKSIELFIFNRSSNIPSIFKFKNIKIYSGKYWINRFITKWAYGHKFGELTWNRKLALYKAKQLKKK